MPAVRRLWPSGDDDDGGDGDDDGGDGDDDGGDGVLTSKYVLLLTKVMIITMTNEKVLWQFFSFSSNFLTSQFRTNWRWCKTSLRLLPWWR